MPSLQDVYAASQRVCYNDFVCARKLKKLHSFYNEANSNEKTLEIVFVSNDKCVLFRIPEKKEPIEVHFFRSEEEMLSYMNEMHGNWPAIRYSDDLREDLMEKYDKVL